MPTRGYESASSSKNTPPPLPRVDPAWNDLLKYPVPKALGVVSPEVQRVSDPSPSDDPLVVDTGEDAITRKIDGVFASLAKPKPSSPERGTTRAWGAARSPSGNSKKN